MDHHHQLPHSSPLSNIGMPPMCHVFGDNQDIMPSNALFVPDFGKAPSSLVNASLHESSNNNSNSAYMNNTTSPLSSSPCPRDDISTPACGSPISQYDDNNSSEESQQACTSWVGGNDNSSHHHAVLSRHSSFSLVMHNFY